MISVQNHRQLLSGNKLFALLICLAVLSGCSPKVLRPKGAKEGKESAKEAEKAEKESKEEPLEKKAIDFNNIALVLPFQLNKISNAVPNKMDVERSGLALDFYQGFKMGLDQLASEGDNFRLDVLDSKDNAVEIQRLAASKEVQDAQLVVGPVFPTEINVFSSSASLGNRLQISPLAASNPSRYQVNNLVTVTPPIEVHAKAIGNYIKKQLQVGDQVVLLNIDNEDSKKFLEPIKTSLEALNIPFKEVAAVPDIEASLATTGKNIVITGAVNPFFIAPLLVDLHRLKTESEYDISLIGHPNWIKLDLDSGYLIALNACISSSFYVDELNTVTRRFKAAYKSQYQIEPTEFAFKGYDAGLYFGRLLAKYPKDYAAKLVKEKFKGLSMGFDFVKNPSTGYVNNHIMLLHFTSNGFSPM